MIAMLQEAIAGAPTVTITLNGVSYPVGYPIQAVILYKQETAALDRERNRASGHKALTREEKRALRGVRRQLLEEATKLRPGAGEPWDEDHFNEFQELLADAMVQKAALDSDAALGDSLYDKSNWFKIGPESDPERLLLALWVGLHRFVSQGASRIYAPAVAKEQLGELVNLSNGADLTETIAKVLRAHLESPPEVPLKESEEQAELPNVQPQEGIKEPATVISGKLQK